MININSKNNEKVKYVKSLLKKKYRDKNKSCILEGYRIIKDVDPFNLDFFMLEEGMENNEEIASVVHENEEIPAYLLSKEIFNQISDTQNSQGIIAVAKTKEYGLEEILKDENDFLLVLDRIQDPGNMGTIIRTADSAGVKGIICIKGSVDIYNNKVLRSTMGSIFNIPIVYIDQSDLWKVGQAGYKIVSSYLQTENYYNEIAYPEKTALVIGNEGNGISQEIIDQSDILVKIPIYGKNESLNAGIASGILMYKIRETLNINVK